MVGTPWKRIDAFAKPRADLRQTSALGGIVTVLASTAALLLFIGQVYSYITGVTRHSLQLSPSHWHPVPTLDEKNNFMGGGRNQAAAAAGHMRLNMHVSFPYITCSRLDLTHDGMSYKDPKFRQIHGGASTKISTRPLSTYEYHVSTGQSPTSSSKTPTQNELHQGCTFLVNYQVPTVGGAFTIGLSPAAWSEVAGFLMMGFRVKEQSVNTTHYIHHITFGHPFPLMKNPLSNDLHLVVNDAGGIALANVNVKLIPTKYTTFWSSRDHYYQVSMTEHIMQPETLAGQGSRFLPGLAVSYDFGPLQVHHMEDRDSILVFISSLVSIVGGVFVTVKLITGCLVMGAAEIAKKMD